MKKYLFVMLFALGILGNTWSKALADDSSLNVISFKFIHKDTGKQDEIKLTFTNQACFTEAVNLPFINFSGAHSGVDDFTITPLGNIALDWAINASLNADGSLTFANGLFTISEADGTDGIFGSYKSFVIDATGKYTLEWQFTGGTGKFVDARGHGTTLGQANLSTGCAQYSFTGEVSM